MISGSILHFGNAIEYPNANWLKIKIQLKNNNFTCCEYKHYQKNDNYIHPNDPKKEFTIMSVNLKMQEIIVQKPKYQGK